MIWFTSDTHFGHANVLKFSERPWDDIYDMNHALIENINACAEPSDELYILGDFSFKLTVQQAYELRNSFAARKSTSCTAITTKIGASPKSPTRSS